MHRPPADATAGDAAAGTLLGLALGDALGAPREGGPLERALWRVLGRPRGGHRRWTDDTRMSLDLAESLLAEGRLDQDDLARRFANSYRWHRGYGPGAARMLRRVRRGTPWREANRSVFPDGSYGNGAAMRAPMIGLCFRARPAELVDAAHRSAEVTHAHPLAKDGAALLAVATARSLEGASVVATFDAAREALRDRAWHARAEQVRAWLVEAAQPEPRAVVAALGNGIAALDSCLTAVFVGLAFRERPFLVLVDFVARCRGDVDTIGAMAGALWGAANGASRLPAEKLHRLERCEHLRSTAHALGAAAFPPRAPLD